MFALINPSVVCLFKKKMDFLNSHAADKCNNREAAADQTLPPLRNRLQVRFGDILQVVERSFWEQNGGLFRTSSS